MTEDEITTVDIKMTVTKNQIIRFDEDRRVFIVVGVNHTNSISFWQDNTKPVSENIIDMMENKDQSEYSVRTLITFDELQQVDDVIFYLKELKGLMKQKGIK